MKVLLHGFGSFPVFFYHVIKMARRLNYAADWAVILTSDHYKLLFTELLGTENVLVLDQSSKVTKTDIRLNNYHGSIYKDLAADKRTFKSQDADRQINRAVNMYDQVKNFVSHFKPTHALVSQVEGFDGKVFIAVAKELGVEVVVPTSCRNIGGIYFAPDDLETLPNYVNEYEPETRDAARNFIQGFISDPKAARWLQDLAAEKKLDNFQKSFTSRFSNQIKRWITSPSLFQWDDLRASFLNNLPYIRNAVWAIRAKINGRICDISKIDSLPDKFIYYPLQYSPESSINTPAPYYLDQSRAIDAIRFSMPSDYVLVVKEHPACIYIRNGAFVRELKKTAGVMVAHYQLPSVELTKRAAITISVTGTATLEAFILGKASIALGPGLCAEILGGVCSQYSLPHKIEECLEARPSDEKVVTQLSKLFSVRYEISFGSPGIPGEPILRVGNVMKFTNAFFDHCNRIKQTNKK